MPYQQMETMNQSSRSISNKHIEIRLSEQVLRVFDGDTVLRQYSISSGVNGAGELNGSGCTPRGAHRVRLKIGQGCALNTVFRGRRPTGEIYSAGLASNNPQCDWILTRIIWLTGTQPGVNRGGNVDTLRRFIYLHGCPDTEPMGIARSHGCIRMRNTDIIELFELVYNQMPVFISE
jgi:hypothetical protein